MTVDFVHRTSKPENPKVGSFYWVEDSTGSQIWFAPSDDPSELILLNDVEFLTEKDIEDIRKGVEDVRKDVEDVRKGVDGVTEGLSIVTALVGDPGIGGDEPTGIFERLFKLKNEILSQVDSKYEKKLTWKVIK